MRNYTYFITCLLTSALMSGCGMVHTTISSIGASKVVVSLEQPNLTISEGDLMDLGVSLSERRDVDTIVTIAVNSSRGDVVADFHTLPPTSFTIPAGSLSARFNMRLANDSIFEGPESFVIELSTVDSGVTLAPATYTLTVDDDTAQPTVNFASATSFAHEGSAHPTIRAELSAASQIDTVVNYTVSGTALYVVDHSLADGAVTVAAGATYADITVPLINDTTAEMNETIEVTLISSAQATVGVASAHVLTVIDNELGVTIEQASAQSDPTNTLPISFDVTFTQPIDPATFLSTDFTQSGTATGVVWSLLAKNSNNDTWTLSATAIGGDGTLIPSLLASRVSTADPFANDASTSADNTVRFDTTAPTVTLNRRAGVAVALSALPPTAVFDVVFSEPILPTSFTGADITQTGTATGVTWSIADSGNATNFTLTVTAATDGSIIPSLAAGAVTDVAGNGITASTSTDNFFIKGLAVIPAYTANGRNWNDYVKNDGTEFRDASGAACVGTEKRFHLCRHAGEIRRIVLPGVLSCANITATDTLGAFDWGHCDTAIGFATLYSKTLKSGKGLNDLLKADGSGWKSNSVSIAGDFVGSTTAEAWWTNPVIALPDNSGATALVEQLGVPSAVYVLTSTRQTAGYQITGDKVSVVTLASSLLRYNGSANSNCNPTTAMTVSPNQRCVVFSPSTKFLWLEGTYDATTNGTGAATLASRSLVLVSNSFSRLNNLNLRSAEANRIATSNSLSALGLNVDGWGAFEMVSMTGSSFLNTRFSRQAFSLQAGSNANLFENFVSSGAYGNYTDASRYNVFKGFILTASSGGGFSAAGSSAGNTFAGITAANTMLVGLAFYQNEHSTLNNLLAMNNAEEGFFSSASYTSFSNLASAHNSASGIRTSGSYSRFAGSLLSLSNSSPCIVGGVTQPGLVNSTCAPTAPTVAPFQQVTHASRSLATSIVGILTVDDISNPGDTNGSIAGFPNDHVFDWFKFDSGFRVWQKYGGNTSNSHSGHRGHWPWFGAGRIWDWSLRAADTEILNKTGNAIATNDPFINGAACPTQVDGSFTTTDYYDGEHLQAGNGNEDGVCDAGETCGPRTFLINAFEILGDEIGNDNALCESSEACIYTPNFGAYQGHGDYRSNTCTFADGVGAGTVSGVQMYAYPVNGY